MNRTFSFLKHLSLVAVAMFSSCSGINPDRALIPPVATTLVSASSITAEGQVNAAHTLTPVVSTSSTVTPPARIFKKADCGGKVEGHIFFLQTNGSWQRNYASRYDLYVMDGNGCSARFVMSEVSGSPAWSKDGERLAIGCENNVNLCILDVKKTLDACSNSANTIGECSASIIQKIELPVAISGNQYLYNISWSPGGSQIAVEGGNPGTYQYYVYVLTLSGGANPWKLFLRGLSHFDVAWSSEEDQIAMSGLSFINVQSIGAGNKGYNPEWSPDGEKIAFVKPSFLDDTEAYGIALMDPNGGSWNWLYEPAPVDKNYYPPHNMWIGDDGDHRLLSWSPDARYIAFVAEIDLGVRSHIFRLDTMNGEFVNLTINLGLGPVDVQGFLAPAWGP